MKKEILNEYYDFESKELKFKGYYLEKTQKISNLNLKNQEKSLSDKLEIEKEALIKLKKLKYNHDYQSALYFIHRFKTTTQNLDENFIKTSFKIFILENDLNFFEDYNSLSLFKIYEKFYLLYNSRSKKNKKEFENLDFKNFKDIESYIDQLFFFIDRIHSSLSVKSKIEMVMSKLSENYKKILNENRLENTILNNRKKFINFIH